MSVKKHVLVVDDAPGVLRFVKIGLVSSGYDVTTSASGEEALQIVKSREPDIILLDILMVPMTGFEVLEYLREFSQVAGIVFTAKSNIAEQALKCGADGFLAKPFAPEQLVEKIESVLAQKRADHNEFPLR